MTRIRPTLNGHRLDLPSICYICQKARSTRNHAKCSRIRQQRKQDEWAAYMANVAAKQSKGKRYAR